MMVNIANPIYDSVFKYLMEDERIARTLISALLKKEVLDVDMRRNEYTNGSRDNISMFRIDFGARVQEDDGSTKLILIELQKTWLETETLRFRQYLGAQYANPENILKDCENEGSGIPMVAVYLLGHKVGDIEEPVLYVSHKAFDYDGNRVSKGIPDPFVESLTHDSIIVQIPRLRGHVNNRLDEVLSFFDQSMKNKYNHQVLLIDENKYDGDTEMMHILHRLLTAASDTKLRQDMNVEDEFFSAIENRDTEIMLRDKKIALQGETIASQGETIASQGETIASQGETIASQGETIASQNKTIQKLERERNAAVEQMRSVAKIMLSNGVPKDEVAKATNLSKEELDSLTGKE